MKMRKVLALALSLVLTAGILAGCKSKSPTPAQNAEKITILYPGEESDRMTDFLQNEFAAKMKQDLNLEVELIFVPWDQYWEKKDIMLANKEPIDLYWDGLPDLSSMVNKQQCQPLDDLIKQYGQDMLKVLPMEQINGGKVKGTIYGIPTAYAPSSCMYQLICVRQDILEDVGMNSIETPEDLMKFSQLAKEKYPDIKGGGDPIFKPLTRYYTDEQYNWVGYQDLVVFGEDTHKAYSYFETEAFQELCKFNRRMNQAGLYNDDVTTKYNERDSRMQTGNYLWVEGSLGKENEIIDAVRANAPDAKLKSYLLSPEKGRYITAAGGEVLCVPHSATNPAGAIKFLNWLYSSQENYLFALYGVEGKDYEIVDGRIKDLTTDDLFYEWMFRNQNYQMFAPEVDQAYIDSYKNWDSTAKLSASFGFAFDNENVKDLEAKLGEATGKLCTPLETGFVDFDTAYPEMVKALKDAGIDQYVAEVQRQLDEYLATK